MLSLCMITNIPMVYGNWEAQRDSHLEQMAMKGAFVKVNRTDALASSRDHFNDFIPWKSDKWRTQVLFLTWVMIRPNLVRFQVHQGKWFCWIITAGEPEVKMIWMRTDIWRNFVTNYSIPFMFNSWHCPVCEVVFIDLCITSSTEVVTWEALDQPRAKIAKGAEWTVSEFELHQFFIHSVLPCHDLLQECNLELKLTMLTPCESL